MYDYLPVWQYPRHWTAFSKLDMFAKLTNTQTHNYIHLGYVVVFCIQSVNIYIHTSSMLSSTSTINWLERDDHSMVLSSRKVLILEDPRGPIYKSFVLDLKSLSSDHKCLSLDHKVLENCKSGMYDHVVHKFGYRRRARGYGEWRMTYLLISDITYYKVSKPFFIVTQSCWQSSRKVLVLKDPRGPICKSLSLEVLVLGPQILVLVLKQ